MVNKTTIFVFCPRLFDIRYLIATGVIRILAERLRIIIFVPMHLVNVVEMALEKKVEVRELKITNEEFENVLFSFVGRSIRLRICRSISTIFGLVYSQRIRKNLSQALHIKNLLKKRKEQGGVGWLLGLFIVAAALLLSRSLVLRRLLQKIFYYFAPKSEHGEHYDALRPALVVTCTLALGVDGVIMAEAQRNSVPTVTAVQSWDKTSTKGYPIVLPDAAILWSHVTAEEAAVFLDLPRKLIYVEGAPLWDKHFIFRAICSRESFFHAHRLDQTTKLIAVSIGSPCYHIGNMRLIDFLISQKEQDKFEYPVSLIFRQHPGYLSYGAERVEMAKFINARSGISNVAFMDVETHQYGGELMYREADSDNLCEMFSHCDLSISIASSHLIEASIFGKPAINIEYGQWVNDMYNFDLSEYRAEHLYRIYGVDAIYRATSEKELIEMTNEAIISPDKTRAARELLVSQEAPVNQGYAARQVSMRILSRCEAN